MPKKYEKRLMLFLKELKTLQIKKIKFIPNVFLCPRPHIFDVENGLEINYKKRNWILFDHYARYGKPFKDYFSQYTTIICTTFKANNLIITKKTDDMINNPNPTYSELPATKMAKKDINSNLFNEKYVLYSDSKPNKILISYLESHVYDFTISIEINNGYLFVYLLGELLKPNEILGLMQIGEEIITILDKK